MKTKEGELRHVDGDIIGAVRYAHVRAGFADRQILDAILIVSYFNFVNRIAEGLDVQAGEEEVTRYKY